jgi:hypothetical protein
LFLAQLASILGQPVSQSIQTGSNVIFGVTASGTLTPNYQWLFKGQNIPDATNATLTLNVVTATKSGGYSVIVFISLADFFCTGKPVYRG